MNLIQKFNHFFEVRKDYGAIFLRIIIGLKLIEGTQDNIFSWPRMLEFRDFLEQRHVIYPLIAAHVSVYAQFTCGLLLLAGAFTRLAAVLMIVNFLAALYIAHIGHTFQQSFDALVMLFSALFFLFHGAGKVSVDDWLLRRRSFA